jgi:hypothetical protein
MAMYMGVFQAGAQLHKDSIAGHSAKYANNWLIPSTVLVGGLFLNGSKAERQFQQYVRGYTGDSFRVHVDDYLQYAPIVQLYATDLAGYKAEHHWFDQTKLLLISHLITAGITTGLKRLILKRRPDGMPQSFPSGHTSFAFVNASVMRKEYVNTAPCWSYTGYLFALTTGPMRVLNNRHWISDTLAGAGIAMLVTELIYYWDPLSSWNPFIKNKKRHLSLIPFSWEQGYGMQMNYSF